MSTPLALVTELQHALSEAEALDRLINGIPDWMEELHAEHSERKAEIDAIQQIIDEAAAERRAAEATAADCEEKLKHYQDQISQVRNQREYGALLQEIDTVKAQIRECEEQTLTAIDRSDEAEKSLNESRAAFEDLDQRYGDSLKKWEAEKPEVARQAGEVRERIASLETELPRGTLQYFRRVFERHSGNALAAVLEVPAVKRGAPAIWHCGECNYRVRPQAVVEITNHGNLVLCDSCKRILHRPDTAAPVQAGAAQASEPAEPAEASEPAEPAEPAEAGTETNA